MIRSAAIYIFAFFGTAAVVAIVATPFATAQPAPSMEKILKRMDADSNGQVTQQEWLGQPVKFAGADANGDKVLTKDELLNYFGSQTAPDWPHAYPKSAGAALAEAAGAPLQKNDAQAGAVSGTTSGPKSLECAHGAGSNWIDTHVHVPGRQGPMVDVPGAVRAAAEVMNPNRICRMVLMPVPEVHGRFPPQVLEDFLAEARKYPNRFLIMGGGGSLNPMIHDNAKHDQVDAQLKNRFENRSDAIIGLGAIGFGEVGVLHLAAFKGQEFESVAGDHPLFLQLADITAQHDVVIDIHFDLVTKAVKTPRWLPQPPNPPQLKPNIKGFERFLKHNRKARIVWAHLGSDFIGFRTPDQMRRMLNDHPNLYMSLRLGPGRVPSNHPMAGKGIKSDWMKLFKDFPDRFVIGTDQIFSMQGAGSLSKQHEKQRGVVRQNTNRFLSYLPAQLKRMIAYENAIRIYKIKM